MRRYAAACLLPPVRQQIVDDFLDFRFAQYPQCLNCDARRAMRLAYGMRVTPDVEPSVYLAGIAQESWIRSTCEHRW